VKRWDERLVEDRPDLLLYTDEAVEQIFVSRGIHPQVWQARPYTPYNANDMAAVVTAEPKYGGRLKKGIAEKVAQRPGLVMARSGFFSSERQLAQLRPFKFQELDSDLDLVPYGAAEDDGVFLRLDVHDHHWIEKHAHIDGRLAWPATNKSRRASSSDRRDVDLEVEAVKAGFDAISQQLRMEQHLKYEHGGESPEDGVLHEHAALVQTGHLEKKHRGRHRTGRHSHEVRAKYLYPPSGKDRSPFLIDAHPYARDLLDKGGEVVYFALEGLLKADAILSVGFTGPGSGTPVVNCGSVTLWQDYELQNITERYLRNFGLVVVVPDSDGSGNRLVSSEAAALSARLRKLGANAIVAAPPAQCGAICDHRTRLIGHRTDPKSGLKEPVALPDPRHKQGVDDFLGPRKERVVDDVRLIRGGGTLGELVVETPGKPVREISVDELHASAVDAGNRKARSRAKSDKLVLDAVLAIASPDGVAVFGQRGIATEIGKSRGVVEASLKSLEAAGIIGLSAFEWPGTPEGFAPPTTAHVLDLALLPPPRSLSLADYRKTKTSQGSAKTSRGV
jgi:hypothetical protein